MKYYILSIILFVFIGCSNDNDLLYYKDKEVIKLFSAKKGKGIDLVFMGDGFTLIDMVKEKGKYEKCMRLAAEHFFSVEPYKSYRDYFNGYMIVAESEEEGISGEWKDIVNSKFKAKYRLDGTVDIDPAVCMEYVEFALNKTELDNITCFMILNSNAYDGACYRYRNGFSISLCAMSDSDAPYDFRGLINHEAGGHGFGRLADEYIKDENKGKNIPLDEMESVRYWQSIESYMNVDFTSELEDIVWKDFIGLSSYANVGAYEGGYYYSYGVWRPEELSCMVNNIPYYNAPGRWAIIKRIKDLAGESFTFNDFLKTDIIDREGIETMQAKARTMGMPPLPPPVLIK